MQQLSAEPSFSAERSDAGRSVAGPSSRVLIVCNDPRVRDQLRRSAVEIGAACATAESAEAALRALAQQPYDIALIDLTLRNGAGGDLLESIRQRWTWVQIILLGAVAEDPDARHALRVGTGEILTRPFSQREIVSALSRAHRRRMHDIGLAGAGDVVCTTPIFRTPADVSQQPAALGEIERVHILAALERHHGNREAAANELGISVRKLYYRLQQYQRDGLMQ